MAGSLDFVLNLQRQANGLSQTTTVLRNAQGQVYRITEPGSLVVTEYQYNAVGELVTIRDPAGNITNNTVDLRGRVTQRSDPSLGTWSYQYTVLDQLKQQTDARSQSSTLSYDKLGRLVQLVSPGTTSTFTFDTASYGKGQLAQMSTSAGDKRSHTFDSLGRPVSTTIRVDSVDRIFTSTYNSDGRLATVQYPSGYQVRYE